MKWVIKTDKGYFDTNCLECNLFTDDIKKAFVYKTEKELMKDFNNMKKDKLNPVIIVKGVENGTRF